MVYYTPQYLCTILPLEWLSLEWDRRELKTIYLFIITIVRLEALIVEGIVQLQLLLKIRMMTKLDD